eukprot:CAMPEP_0172768018 /NCGR_PEP_ID=MMETSP1074-20121228/183942_2 /TAXON_ID=2916 /ORGANISM="Ceratium fusus, Strain PA161109" /LENGTH=130 /DNA_ID=CAMNT_0013603353 /DNA_START=1246 /DNA_END=1639 /DNA_ORIENTATION=-
MIEVVLRRRAVTAHALFLLRGQQWGFLQLSEHRGCVNAQESIKVIIVAPTTDTFNTVSKRRGGSRGSEGPSACAASDAKAAEPCGASQPPSHTKDSSSSSAPTPPSLAALGVVVPEAGGVLPLGPAAGAK